MDVAKDRLGQALPTVAGFGARLALAVLKERNVAIAPLLRRTGLSEDDFDSRRHRISAASQSTVFEYAAEAMDDGAFGLHLAKDANPREAGLLFYVMSAANSLSEALTLLALQRDCQRNAAHQTRACAGRSRSRDRLRRLFQAQRQAGNRVWRRPDNQGVARDCRSEYPTDTVKLRPRTQRQPAVVRALLRLPGRVWRNIRSICILA